MDYPLQMSFKILAIAPQVAIRDSSGTMRMYVKQKLFKLKEAVNVFSDKSQKTRLYSMKADRVFDFSARYNFADAGGGELGAVKRAGMRSLWRTHWDIYEGDEVVASVREESVLKRFLEGIAGDVPLVGFVLVMLINPSYIVKRADGTPVFRLTKKPAFFEGKFEIARLADDVDDREEKRTLLALIMMALLERKKG